MDTMNILVCATRNLYPQLHRMLVMLNRTQEAPYRVYVFVEDDLEVQSDFITDINLSGFEKATKNEVNGRSNWTWMTLARCYAAEILPNVDKILYLDLDMEITGSLRELWDMDMSGFALAGVVDTGVLKYKLPYINDLSKYMNAGVLLMNLKFFREHELTEKLDELLHKWSMTFRDQDALNIVCENNSLILDNKWNSSPSTGFNEQPIINHATDGVKPWDPRSKFFPSFAKDYVNNGAPFSYL